MKAKKKPDMVEELKLLKDFMKNLSQWTGKEINSPFDIYHVYMSLDSERFMNLTLPP